MSAALGLAFEHWDRRDDGSGESLPPAPAMVQLCERIMASKETRRIEAAMMVLEALAR